MRYERVSLDIFLDLKEVSDQWPKIKEALIKRGDHHAVDTWFKETLIQLLEELADYVPEFGEEAEGLAHSILHNNARPQLKHDELREVAAVLNGDQPRSRLGRYVQMLMARRRWLHAEILRRNGRIGFDHRDLYLEKLLQRPLAFLNSGEGIWMSDAHKMIERRLRCGKNSTN